MNLELRNSPIVIPAKAGIQVSYIKRGLDSRFCGNDREGDITHKSYAMIYCDTLLMDEINVFKVSDI